MKVQLREHRKAGPRTTGALVLLSHSGAGGVPTLQPCLSRVSMRPCLTPFLTIISENRRWASLLREPGRREGDKKRGV